MTTIDKLLFHRLLTDLHAANHAQLIALTAVIEHQDERIAQIERMVSAASTVRGRMQKLLRVARGKYAK